MLTYRQHRPTYFEGFDAETGEVANAEELLALECVKRFTDGFGKPFHRFSLSSSTSIANYHELMVEYDEGREWWVVATLTGDATGFDLPQWVPVYDKKPE